jgi:hypothetical protein
MLDSIYVIQDAQDINLVEQRIISLCHGTQGRCTILNSAEYMKLRLAALYPQTYGYDKHAIIQNNKMRIVLENRTIFIYCDDPPLYEESQSLKRKLDT